jgi:hypothetical protein
MSVDDLKALIDAGYIKVRRPLGFEYCAKRVSMAYMSEADSPDARLVAAMNALDREGWEVVSVAKVEGSHLIVARRRQDIPIQP